MASLQTDVGIFRYEILPDQKKPTLKVYSNNSENALLLLFIKKEGWVYVRPTQVPGSIENIKLGRTHENEMFFYTNYDSPFDSVKVDAGVFNHTISKTHILNLCDSNKLGFGSDDFHVICTFFEDMDNVEFEIKTGAYCANV